MREENKAKKELLDELLELRRRNAELEASETRTKGHIYVSSEPGKGTTFIIALPQHHDRT